MNFSDDRESRDSTTPSFGKGISTSSSSTEDQAREGEVVPAAFGLLGEAAIPPGQVIPERLARQTIRQRRRCSGEDQKDGGEAFHR